MFAAHWFDLAERLVAEDVVVVDDLGHIVVVSHLSEFAVDLFFVTGGQ